MNRQSTGHAHDWHQDRLNKINRAKIESELCFARANGMKLRAQLTPPQPTAEHMPFAGHRTCAEWGSTEQ